MPVLQPVYRTGPRNRSLARNLIAGAQQPAAYVLASTELCEGYETDVTVVSCTSRKVQVRCGVCLVPGQRYWMVRSQKFASRWYVVTRNVKTDAWMTSSRDTQVSHRCIREVEAFLAARKKVVAA